MEEEVVDGDTVLEAVAENPDVDAAAARDPVCGMPVPDPTPVLSVREGGRQYHFCSSECRDAFSRQPERFAVR